MIVAEWVEELSAKLNRSKDELLAKGLSATDFSSNSELAIEFPDGSSANFRYAFFVESKAKNKVAVFTEHCGYFVFPRYDLKITETICKVIHFDEE
jgi:hypothetical protein